MGSAVEQVKTCYGSILQSGQLEESIYIFVNRAVAGVELLKSGPLSSRQMRFLVIDMRGRLWSVGS